MLTVMIVVRDAGSNGDEVLGLEVIMNNDKKEIKECGKTKHKRGIKKSKPQKRNYNIINKHTDHKTIYEIMMNTKTHFGFVCCDFFLLLSQPLDNK